MNIFIQLIENVLVMKTLPKIIFSVVGVCSYCNNNNNNNNNKLFIRTYQYGLIEHISYKS